MTKQFDFCGSTINIFQNICILSRSWYNCKHRIKIIDIMSGFGHYCCDKIEFPRHWCKSFLVTDAKEEMCDYTPTIGPCECWQHWLISKRLIIQVDLKLPPVYTEHFLRLDWYCIITREKWLCEIWRREPCHLRPLWMWNNTNWINERFCNCIYSIQTLYNST